MDAMDILGDLLGHKAQKPGRATDVLKDIFGRGSQRSTSARPKKPSDIHREAEELEELLNVANQRSSTRRSGSTASRQQQTKPLPPKEPPISRSSKVDRPGTSENDRAIVLIRAMINAAKADGRIDAAEQKIIIEQISNPSRENIDFLRMEFAAPLDIQEFVRSVPIGMEQQVYTMSLIAIDLDTRSESNYLSELAQWLRIPVNVREQIHGRLGA